MSDDDIWARILRPLTYALIHALPADEDPIVRLEVTPQKLRDKSPHAAHLTFTSRLAFRLGTRRVWSLEDRLARAAAQAVDASDERDPYTASGSRHLSVASGRAELSAHSRIALLSELESLGISTGIIGDLEYIIT